MIYNNTLYTFQPDAFQSLELRPGGNWSALPMGVATTGSVCVQGSPRGEDSLFIVGGKANSLAPQWFSGLQQYSFKDKTWKQLTPANTSAKNRVGHSSAYLNESSSILIYAGSQDGRFPSSQTFTISTIPPYLVRAYNTITPPLIKPLIVPLNASHALLLEADSYNKNLSTFGPEPAGPGWQPFPTQLTIDVKNSSYMQAVITDGGDGSQLLEVFDMNVSPNEVLTQSLQPAATNRKREDRPAYNSTLASSTSRTGFSLAQDSAGLVVISGGAANDSDYLCLFDQTGNQWIDPAQFFFEAKSDVPNATPTTSSPAPSLTQSALPSSTSAPIHENVSKSHPMTILGATLGSVFGLVALLLIILLLLRCIRRRQARDNGRDYPLHDKHDMDFADRGVDSMREAGGIFPTNSPRKTTGSGRSVTSLAVMSGGSAGAGSQHSKRGFFHKAGDSSGSAKSFFSRAKSPLAPSPPVISGPIQPINPRDHNNQVTASPDPRTEPRTDVGWSTYFTNNSAMNLDQSHPGNPHRESASRPTTYASNSQSDYDSSPIASSNARESAEVQPLSLRTNVVHPSNSRVVSPTSGLPLPGLALASISPGGDPPSPSTLVSDMDEDEDYRHDEDGRLASEGMAPWTPVAASDRGNTWTDRPNSSIYGDPHPGEHVPIPNFPGVPSTARNSTVYNSQAEPAADSRGMRSMASREFKTSHADLHDRELPEIGSRRAAPPASGSTSDGMGYSRRPEEMVSRGRGAPEPEDMSWLNLGR